VEIELGRKKDEDAVKSGIRVQSDSNLLYRINFGAGSFQRVAHRDFDTSLVSVIK